MYNSRPPAVDGLVPQDAWSFVPEEWEMEAEPEAEPELEPGLKYKPPDNENDF